jgi:tetratricopeptide (TPR) repeat protein
MADHLKREDLKRNELSEAIGAGIHYAEGHKRLLLLAIGGAVALGLAVWGYFAFTGSRRDAANELLGRALRVSQAEIVPGAAKPEDSFAPTFTSTLARDARANELFTELDDRYGSTSVGRVAKLFLAESALAAGDAAKARSLWEAYLAADDSSPVALSAYVNLFELDRSEGKSEQLVEKLRGMLEDPARPLPADLLLYQLALTYEKLERPGDAAASYRRIVDEHPQSPYYATAQQHAAGAPAGGPA